MNALIIYGSTTANTETAAEKIAENLTAKEVSTTLKNINEVVPTNEYENYDLIIFGSSTWGLGELQDDWLSVSYLNSLNLDNKFVAFFGTGDQSGFADTFVDALGILYNDLKGSKAKFIGKWSTEGYHYSDSAALVDEDNFVGLALDEENQGDLTDERIAQWVQQLLTEMK